jgi:Tol biopolymer transport system component
MALPFNIKRLEPAGEPFSLAQRIVTRGEQEWLASASKQGVLAFVSGERGGWQYVLRDRQGRRLAAFDGAATVAMISPDGKRLVGDRPGDIWVLEFKHGLASRLTFSPPPPFNPIWSQDGRYVAYAILGTGIFRKEADGSRAQELLLRTDRLAVPKSWSPDGRFILYAQINPGTGADLLAFPVEPDPKPIVVAQTQATEDQGQFSPDGHWVAYTSNESGLSEVYVVPFPPSPNGGKWVISRGGGVQPRWNRDGKELFYISPDSEMMTVPIETQPVFTAGSPQPLFQTEIVDTGIRTGPISWDVMPDGNRFVIITANSTDTSSLTVALNWRGADQGKR